MYNTKSEPNVNYGLQAIMVCLCRFIDCNKCPTLVGDVNSGGGYACGGQRLYGNSLYLLLNFAVKSKTALKSKVY